MARFLRKNDRKAGMPPGSLIFTGQQKISKPQIRVTTYNDSSLTDIDMDEYKSITNDTDSICWINIDGVHDSDLIKNIGDNFNISIMNLEDIQDTGQRPCIDEYQDYLFATMKFLNTDNDEDRIKADQISFVLGNNYLITFQEQPSMIFDPVRKRLSKPKNKFRQNGPDYLFYTLIDCLLENYLKVIEGIGERIEEIEEEVLENPIPEQLEEINFYRREIAYIRKSIRPAREIISKTNKMDSEFISDNTAPYLKDLVSMLEQALDSLEIYKEILSDLFSTYNMSINSRLNETMKFLTVFATIFIPLTFLAGIYGMNFDVIPELHYKYSYYILLGLMLLIAFAMLAYFKRKKWI
ncbi:magnesium/cobalt transporter CorA [Maridesulfovibrio zosterae]|uniref:magnesium/cobalt transporter CorA n=1 Tax=Maridesulfovibrio zosterae TaxID=82171 RepID=UPI00042097ED|nr:magnesium/cobalt transporter CorA [Maridesulfovibrio zosterae]